MSVIDFLVEFYEKGGVSWTLLLIAVGFILWLLAHPNIVKEWNVIISTWIAGFVPKKRKKAFEKRIDLTIESVKTKFKETMPDFAHKFLPLGLKVEWVSESETIESVVNDKQIIVYVPSYNDETQQTIGILHNYCTVGFAEKSKIYMSDSEKDASDLIMTEKLVKHAGAHIFDYYNRVYRPDVINKNRNLAIAYDRLKKIDTDGLFIPVFLNEIDKFANRIYPASPTPEIEATIDKFSSFLCTIVSRNTGEMVNLTFAEGGINIRIVLAISDYSRLHIKKVIETIEKHIKDSKIKTIYVLASGSKTRYANEIATKLYERNPQDIFKPIVTQYKRYTRRIDGMDSICFEIDCRD